MVFFPVFDGVIHGSGGGGTITSLTTSSASHEDLVTSNGNSAASQLADSAAVESLSDVFRCFICMERLRSVELKYLWQIYKH
jgi:hypothetical protein